MADGWIPPKPFLSTNVEPYPVDPEGAEALRNPPTPLRFVIVGYAVALVVMVVAIAVLKSPGS
jgi:hypothetical protein